MHGVGRVERSRGSIARTRVKIEFLADAGSRIPLVALHTCAQEEEFKHREYSDEGLIN